MKYLKHKNQLGGSRASGFTLLEVLVAVLVFSFGMLGIAGLMSISVKNNHNGYLRSQANFLAENMVDRMRANPVALWNDDYTGTAATGASNCDSPCTYAELATYDMEQWAQSLSFILPNAVGTIACVRNTNLPTSISLADPPSIWFPAPPYSGVCTVTVSWTESNRDGAADAQTLTMVVQP